MITRRGADNHDPIAWLGSKPVYITTIIAGLCVACMIGLTVALATGFDEVLQKFTFNTQDVIQRGEIWRCLSYSFVNLPDPWFVVSLVMFYIFGRDVEQQLGRKLFLLLYFGLILLGPSILTAAAMVTGQHYRLNQSWVNFSVFLAFATLHPNAKLIFQVTAKVAAWILLGISVTQLLAEQRGPEIFILLASASLSWYFTRRSSPPGLDFVPRGRAAGWRERAGGRRGLKSISVDTVDPHAIIDPLLEKISRSGMVSLSRRERRMLEQARRVLLEK